MKMFFFNCFSVSYSAARFPLLKPDSRALVAQSVFTLASNQHTVQFCSSNHIFEMQQNACHIELFHLLGSQVF